MQQDCTRGVHQSQYPHLWGIPKACRNSWTTVLRTFKSKSGLGAGGGPGVENFGVCVNSTVRPAKKLPTPVMAFGTGGLMPVVNTAPGGVIFTVAPAFGIPNPP